MANLKQKFIKPGRDYNYSEGVKVYNGSGADIAEGDILVTVGYSGPFCSVKKALATNTLSCNGRLLIAKQAIPNTGYGVGLPWKLVTGVNTNAITAGDVVYISNAGAIAAGKGTIARVLGHCVTSHPTTGSWLFSGDLDIAGVKAT